MAALRMCLRAARSRALGGALVLTLGAALIGALAAVSDGAAAGGPAPALVSAQSVGRLERAIRDYEAIAARGGWARLPEGPALRRRDSGPGVAMLRERLLVSGDLEPRERPGTLFDGALEDAVRRFQRRHGLVESGVVYRSTRAVMNVSAADRVAEMRENLDRLRALLGQGGGAREVVVNIPAFALEAVQDGAVALRSRVVVGEPATPTPVMTADAISVTTRPYWHVPRSLVMRDLRPVLSLDPDYLDRARIRVFALIDGRLYPRDPGTIAWNEAARGRLVFRQDPGPENAMGAYRINMPNDRQILLHDTPEKEHFAHAVRAFSAGCVRVERIDALVAWLMAGGPGDGGGASGEWALSGETRTDHFASPVAVRLAYVTAWVDAGGALNFRSDIYRLNGKAPAPIVPETLGSERWPDVRAGDRKEVNG